MNLDDYLLKLTVKEKIALLSGDGMWHIKHIQKLGFSRFRMADGPHGIRKPMSENPIDMSNSEKATCFPTASLVACSFDEALLYKMGVGIANEAIERNVSMVLGPGINIKRNPLCGRNFEYFSEDPLVSGRLARSYIEGLQSKNVGACLKHYLANNQEKNRMTINTIIDKRALYELYLKGFEEALKAKPWALMTSYNKVNGSYVAESKLFLQAIARNRFDFKGAFITDWGAMNDRVKSFKSGLNLEMPGSKNKILSKAYHDHEIKDFELDRAVKPILWLLDKASTPKTLDKVDNHLLAKEIASESIVLLKNDDVLPLKQDEEIFLVGAFGKRPRIQGAGSSQVNPINPSSLYDVFSANKKAFTYFDGYNLEDPEDRLGFEEVKKGIPTNAKVVLLIGLPESFESEGFDRTHLNIPHVQLELIDLICEKTDQVIVVLQGGAPTLMPYKDKVKGILNAYLPGEAGAEAIFDILYGSVNPSGKLAETYPIKLDDCSSTPFFPGGTNAVYYAESIYVGYRYFDKKGLMVNYPFGHGLSYSTFEYSNLIVSKKTLHKKDHIKLSFDMENTSLIDGKEVVQVYVSDLENLVHRPSQELKQFKKVYLKAKEKTKVELTLDCEDFNYYDVDIDDFRVHQGEFMIKIGSSSRDFKLFETISVFGDIIDPQPASIYDTLERYIATHDFESIFGELPPKENPIHHKIDSNSTIGDIKHTFIGRIIHKSGVKEIKKAHASEVTSKMMIEQFESMPLRAIPLFSNDKFTFKKVNGLIKLLNKDVTGIFKLF
ncbi:MAG: glycoside hydrolase family 3 C-terminal domain-containing protein [Acholeplasma sp.]|nr:glycoside hydrolase family 3 C-terminal domain-containing protein [Acholeplasma sp.]